MDGNRNRYSFNFRRQFPSTLYCKVPEHFPVKRGRESRSLQHQLQTSTPVHTLLSSARTLYSKVWTGIEIVTASTLNVNSHPHFIVKCPNTLQQSVDGSRSRYSFSFRRQLPSSLYCKAPEHFTVKCGRESNLLQLELQTSTPVHTLL